MNEIFELVTWADIRPGDRVWSCGDLCTIDGEPFVNDGEEFRPGIMRFRHVPDKGSRNGVTPFAPPMGLDERVARAAAGGEVTVNYTTEARKAGATPWITMGVGSDEEEGRAVYRSFITSKESRGFSHALRLVKRVAVITDAVLELDE